MDYDELVAENQRLRSLLDFKRSHGQFNVVAGTVISREYGTWSNTLVIDVGSDDGISENMAVVTPKGVVGFISDVYPHSSRVQLMTDPRTSIGAIVQRPESRVSSVVRGNGNVPTEPQFVNIAKMQISLKGIRLLHLVLALSILKDSLSAPSYRFMKMTAISSNMLSFVLA